MIGEPTIYGLAAPYNILSIRAKKDGLAYFFSPDCFIWNHVALRFNHFENWELAETPLTLRLKTDQRGLIFEAKPKWDPKFTLFLEAIARRQMGCSVGFEVISSDKAGQARIIRVARVVEISITKRPAFMQTLGEVRINLSQPLKQEQNKILRILIKEEYEHGF